MRNLVDLPTEPLQRSVLRLVQVSKFFPTVAEIRDEVASLICQLPEVGEAWAEVNRAILAVGHMRKPEFSHPLIDEAVRQLGWVDICMSETPTSDRAKFFEAYNQLRRFAWREAVVVAELAKPSAMRYLDPSRAKAVVAGVFDVPKDRPETLHLDGPGSGGG